MTEAAGPASPDQPVASGTTSEPALVAAPVGESSRIVSLDVLRGVAVLGILAMNIQSFSMIGSAYMNPTAYGDLTGGNYWVWYVSALLANARFITIFSMLFGAGIVLMTSRAEAATGRSAGVHYRRMGWLIIFGLLHAHLLWYGDILYTYGMCGLVAYLFRRLPPWLLIALGLVALCVSSGVMALFGLSMPSWDEAMIADFQRDWLPPPEVVQAELDAYRGGWLTQMALRVPAALFFQTFLLVTLIGWQTGGLMLIGMALYKTGFFSAARSTGLYVATAVLGAGIGLPVIAWGIHQHEAHEWGVKYSFFLGSLYTFWAAPLVSLAYASLVMLLCRSSATTVVTRPLSAVGRMALSNYLIQTIVCTTIFYGHGFGLFGQVERTGQLGIVLAVWAAQLVYSPIWLRFFRFGPFEWLWRSLAYWRLQPMRR
jgi:uncharacterized protein